MKPIVSIIIPTLDEAHTILPTLDAIAANETAHEAIVVDGASSDGTADIAEQRGVRVMRATERQSGESNESWKETGERRCAAFPARRYAHRPGWVIAESVPKHTLAGLRHDPALGFRGRALSVRAWFGGRP
jgi:glycosyltransferase involved in cell wall biosynthesis